MNRTGGCTEGPGLLLLGAAACRILRELTEKGSGTAAAQVVPETASWETASIVVLCPAGEDEVGPLVRSVPSGRLRPGTVLCLVTPFRAELSPGLGSVALLRYGPRTCDLLLRMVPARFPAGGRTAVYRQIALASTGLLMPYFVHNMNNLLTRVLGNTELAALQLADTAKARSRLDTALEGVEELRAFLVRLAAHQAAIGREYEEWTAGCEAPVLEIGRMSSGTSVEFHHRTEADFPRVLEVDAGELNTLLGCLVCAATLCVGGCGSVTMRSFAAAGEARFEVSWSCASSGALPCEPSADPALLPLSAAAAFGPPAGVTFRLDAWDAKGGNASLGLPLPGEGVP